MTDSIRGRFIARREQNERTNYVCGIQSVLICSFLKKPRCRQRFYRRFHSFIRHLTRAILCFASAMRCNSRNSQQLLEITSGNACCETVTARCTEYFPIDELYARQVYALRVFCNAALSRPRWANRSKLALSERIRVGRIQLLSDSIKLNHCVHFPPAFPRVVSLPFRASRPGAKSRRGSSAIFYRSTSSIYRTETYVLENEKEKTRMIQEPKRGKSIGSFDYSRRVGSI